MKLVLPFAAVALLSASGMAFAAETQIFTTSAGPVTITPVYHATAIIQAGSDRIYIDPAKPAKIDGLPPGNLILITDIHGDHMDPADVTALSNSTTTVIAPASVQKTVMQAKVLANGDSTTWRKWKITAVPMYNISHNQPSGQPYHDKGRGNGYVLNYGGKNFYFAGDTEGTPEMRALKDIDVAFIPMNLPYTMTPAEAADAVKAFHPKVAIPYHYKGQDIAIFQKSLEGTGIEVRLLNWYPGDK
ncbi:MAG TPA: MBL fold metallo-hydrolase [Rhizomicrobium sp.]|jgi:L-ascorbate metabolism protein UlaG (beta-lactamase superfamily)